MSYGVLVMKSALKSNLRLRSVASGLIGVILVCAAGLAILFGTQFIGPEAASAAPDRAVLENHLGLVMFTTSFLSIGIYASVFAFQSMTREKARGAIQALLATPVTPWDIWVGKSLAVFLPGLVLAATMTVLAFLAISYVYILPVMGLVLTPWMMVSSFLAVPLVYLGVTLLVHIVGLTGKPATGNVVGQVFLNVVLILMINLAVRNLPGAASWPFTVILFGVALAAGVTVFLFRSKLTAERILLSQ